MTPPCFSQALSHTDGDDKDTVDENKWIRILTQRSPEHLNRGKDNFQFGISGIAVCLCVGWGGGGRKDVEFGHLGSLQNA